jgi:hypothetical protein
VVKGWDWEIGCMGRMNRGYDESPIQYAIKGGRQMYAVVNDNLANWFGEDSLVSDCNNNNVGINKNGGNEMLM